MSDADERDESGGDAGVVRRANGTRVPLPLSRRPKRFSRWRWLWLLVPILLVYPIYLTAAALLGVRTVEVEASPLPLDQSGMPDAAWADVLAEHVLAGGRVDYAGLAARPERLERYAATLAVMGPKSTPDRFPTEADALAYYLDAYNALTILGVVTHWPVESIHDVRGPFEPSPGFGFFWALRFELDGDTLNLSDLEDDLLRELGDARIHAAITTASASAPALASEPYRSEALEAQLDAAARRFASEPPHVVVDEAARQIRLSAIYDWYAEDFVHHARGLGIGDTVLDWIAHYAEPAVADALNRARGAGFRVVYAPYDWSVNDA